MSSSYMKFLWKFVRSNGKLIIIILLVDIVRPSKWQDLIIIVNFMHLT